jgi:hypothetical protein
MYWLAGVIYGKTRGGGGQNDFPTLLTTFPPLFSPLLSPSLSLTSYRVGAV